MEDAQPMRLWSVGRLAVDRRGLDSRRQKDFKSWYSYFLV